MKNLTTESRATESYSSAFMLQMAEDKNEYAVLVLLKQKVKEEMLKEMQKSISHIDAFYK